MVEFKLYQPGPMAVPAHDRGGELLARSLVLISHLREVLLHFQGHHRVQYAHVIASARLRATGAGVAADMGLCICEVGTG